MSTATATRLRPVEVDQLDPYAFMAVIGKRVIHPGGRVLATEFTWRKPPTAEAREVFLGQICPGMQFDSVDDWVQLYKGAGLREVEVVTGPFEMMSPAGFLDDEGFAHSLGIMGRVLTHPAYLRKMAWLMPRMMRAIPYLGYILVAGTRPT